MIRILPSAWHRHMHHPVRAAIGAGLAIALTAWTSGMALGTGGPLPFIVASLGASAVLAFGLPASPLAQPRAVIGGNVISALAGIAAHKLLAHPVPAFGLAVALAIIGMYLLRCLHAPGGGLAMIAVTGGPAIAQEGWLFALNPVLLNSLLLVGAAWTWNNLVGSRYPHRVDVTSEPPASTTSPLPATELPTRADIIAVLDELEDLPDIALSDLEAILLAAEARARARSAS